MLNVNYGRNRKLLEACRPLGEYACIVYPFWRRERRSECPPTAQMENFLRESGFIVRKIPALGFLTGAGMITS